MNKQQLTEQNNIQLEFGVPEHGWLLMNFSYRDFVLELDISDVPLDPMVQLCDALIGIAKGINEPDRIIWHLEPYCYYLQVRKSGNTYEAILSESDEFNSPDRTTLEVSGTFEEIILPFYRALKKFWSKSYKPPHWEELDATRMDELTVLMKPEKNNLSGNR